LHGRIWRLRPDVPRHHLGGLGLQLPVTKFLLGEFAAADAARLDRGARAALLALLAILRRQGLAVPRALWPRLVLAALLNVTGWMVLMGLALLWLPASEAR